MLTKAIIQKIDQSKNTCIVRIPLFEQASSSSFIEAEATICITPGIYNNLFVGDIVIVGFEENKMELPIVLGKLFLNSLNKDSKAGALFGDSLNITTKAVLPSSTEFFFDKYSEKYSKYNTPKKLADALLEMSTPSIKNVKRYKTKLLLSSLPEQRNYNYPSGTLMLYTRNDYTCGRNTPNELREEIKEKLRNEIVHYCDFSSEGELICLGFFGEFFLKDGNYAPPSVNVPEVFVPCTLGYNSGEPEFYIRLFGTGGFFNFSMSNILDITSAAE